MNKLQINKLAMPASEPIGDKLEAVGSKWYISRAGRLLPADRGVLAKSQISFRCPAPVECERGVSIAGAIIWLVVAHNLLRSVRESRRAKRSRTKNAPNACNPRNPEQDPKLPRGIRSWKSCKGMSTMRKSGA